MIGQTLGGKYSIVRLLGEGGMGAVYEARHTGTGRRVAVKVITGEHGRDPSLVSRFEREARAAGAIESEHIAQVLDVGRDEASGAPYLAMELLVGEDLGDLFDRLGPVPAITAARIGVQACLGLEKAHAAGIVHRDIKPANLFLARRDSGDRSLKILDFGIAKVEETDLGPDQKKRPLTQTGAVLGSPLYMSPEQARNRGRLDHRTDLWSLGVVLYQALAGRTPLEDAASVGDFIVAVCTTPATPIREHAPWVDPLLASTVERALALDPASRYQSAAEMREALSAFVDGDTALRASLLVRAPEAGPPPPKEPSPGAEDNTIPATPVAFLSSATDPTPPPRIATPTPPPARPSATIPGEPIAAAFTPSPHVPTATVPAPHLGEHGPAPDDRGPPPVLATPAPKAISKKTTSGARLAGIAGIVAIAGIFAIAGIYALGSANEQKSRPNPPAEQTPSGPSTAPTTPTSATDLASLAGAWWAEGGVAYDAVVAGETVELRVRDPELLGAQGYSAGEVVFVLRPVAAAPHAYAVEARVRPAPPQGYFYDHAHAGASCVVSLTHAAGKALKAEEAIDRLVIQSVRIEPALSSFTRTGIRIMGCTDLAEARATETEVVLGRTATQAPLKWVPVHDAGAGAHDAGAAPIHDAGAPPPVHDAGAPPPVHDAGAPGSGGKGYGAPCFTNAQCASRRCVDRMCH